jgi:hypothetical protein
VIPADGWSWCIVADVASCTPSVVVGVAVDMHYGINNWVKLCRTTGNS